MMRYLKSHWFIALLVSALLLVIIVELLVKRPTEKNKVYSQEKEKQLVPDMKELSNSENDNLIRYGRELVLHTSKYLGPHGSVASISNGLNCENCHLEGGTKSFTNNFLDVASTYPKFRTR